LDMDSSSVTSKEWSQSSLPWAATALNSWDIIEVPGRQIPSCLATERATSISYFLLDKRQLHRIGVTHMSI
jgi:hypothetical protein